MTLWKLVGKSLRFYWRTNLSIMLGVAISTAVIVGALIVGDSVKYSLKAISLSKLGKVQYVMATKDRYFRSEFANDLDKELETIVVPALMLNGMVINSDNNLRANQVQIFGIDDRFWKLRNKPSNVNITIEDDFLIINERLSRHIKSMVNDDLLIRVEKASLMPKDVPMSLDTDLSVSFRLNVKAITPNLDLGDFSLQSSQVPPLNAFIPLSLLQNKISLPNRANLMLVGDNKISDIDSIIRKNWRIEDADLNLQEISKNNAVQLSTGRIFLDQPIVDVVKEIPADKTYILTYLVNEIRLNDRKTPYSMVSAIDPIENFSKINDDEIIINSWLADDLKAKIGDSIVLTYFVFGDNRKLIEQTSSFRIKKIVQMEGLANDRSLMPDFPGIAEVENSRDWKAGIPVDLSKIRDKDENYWHNYRGTPKAFITLKAGQSLWSNRFGNLTAIRFPLNEKSNIESIIAKNLNPASVGLFFVPIRERILSSSNPTTDFGQLFLGLSFFLVISALLLTGLLFVFSIQQRKEEIGTLLALGLSNKIIKKAFQLEGLVIVLIGGLVGTGLGIFYTKGVLFALSTIWVDVVGATNLQYHSGISSLLIGAFSGIIMSLTIIWLTLRKQIKISAHQLISSGGEFESSTKKGTSRLGLFIAIISLVISIALIIFASLVKDTKSVGVFFGAGALLLISSFGISHYILSSLSRAKSSINLTLAKMGSRNAVRRRGRSLAIIILLACGSFMIIAIGSNRLDSMKDMEKRSSGTGGFALYAETALPILKDLNDKDEQEALNLDLPDISNISFVQLRVRDGDDASCLNLNRVQNPRLLGVNPDELQKRGSFTFVKSLSNEGFDMLKDVTQESGIKTINAIGDDAMITWSLGLSVGDTIRYTDERGNPFQIRIAGAISNTILQGSLLISENQFKELFPSISGRRVFLIDAPFGHLSDISKTLSRRFQNYGIEITPTYERLSEFNAVQNTYLSIFQMLGGLALILGSLGLGIIVLRNVMERRNELALLRAVGFKKDSIQWFLLSEHWLLLAMGLFFGSISGFIAVIPNLTSFGSKIPYFSLGITLIIITFSGFLWIWLAVKLALRENLISALRNE
ncbi:TPA: ABC transporter permease [bacterium]|nr:ABC transporter permease [bacterium]